MVCTSYINQNKSIVFLLQKNKALSNKSPFSFPLVVSNSTAFYMWP